MLFYPLSILLSAFLIFQVQPMIARAILPWFGGVPAVWSTVQMYFQVLLTGGYAYAAWLVKPGKRREKFHIVVVMVSLLVMAVLGLGWKSPILPNAAWRPLPGSSPIWEIVKLLSITVGLPYFLLSSNSPLVQAWFHQALPGKSAYRLYAISNLGSLLGLVTYPIILEPALTLIWQGRLWAFAYLFYAILTCQGAMQNLRTKVSPPPLVEVSAEMVIKRQRHNYFLWISLAASASILLLATTSHITQEVAVIPFLWVLPLTIYIVSFILAFSGERWYSRWLYLGLFFLATLFAVWALIGSKVFGKTIPQLIIFSLTLFFACMVCHGELYRLRPHPSRLTQFYLLISVGGALGGIIITFIVPILFKGYWELPLGFMFCWLLIFIATRKKDESTKRWAFIVTSALSLSAFIFFTFCAIEYISSDLQSSLFMERSFYGVVRVKTLGEIGWSSQRYALVHGQTVHGIQYADEGKRDLPTAYFSETSGGGLAIIYHPKRGEGMRVGILGLGVGTMATYGQTGDSYRFYEINPQIISLAQGKGGYFSFLQDSQASIEVVPGDARLSLENELRTSHPQDFDVLVLDVFSSDSIPVHLIDLEAFETYLKHLAPDGILAVHITNRHLDLLPVVWTLADHFKMSRAVISDPGNFESVFPSLWVLLSHQDDNLKIQGIASRALNMEQYHPSIPLWTDNYSNLFGILK